MRFIHHSILKSIVFSKTWYSTAAKSQLATLRKETGYPIKNCKKALELHGSNLEEATRWLNEEALKQGWEKATKLQNRTTTQGLIGVHVKDRTAALVEVSCETDFVSKNTIFQDLVKNVTRACCIPHNVAKDVMFCKEQLDTEEMSTLYWNGKDLREHVAMAVSQLGESIVIRRGLLMHASQDLVLSTSVHPTSTTASPLIGTYGALVALKPSPTCSLKEDEMDAVGRQICMHIIGMKPRYITQAPGQGPVQKIAVPREHFVVTNDGEHEEAYAEAPEEDSLLGQTFVFNPEMTVEDVLAEKGLEIAHFFRFERGETVNPGSSYTV